MSRRRKPTDLLLVKIGCTGRSSHKRLVFDTVSVSADGDRIAVTHNAAGKGEVVKTQVPNQDDLGLMERWAATPKVEYATRVYRCPICISPSGHPLTVPMRANKDGEIFGPLAANGVSFLDLSIYSAIVS